MSTAITGAHGYCLQAAGQPLRLCELDPLAPAPNEVVVKVAGCGVCHTDVAFAKDGVPTRHQLPLVLGHEITGRVVAAGDEAAMWMGRSVIVPAVIPCGRCGPCKAGRPTICEQQFMPGNDGNGGFATHVRVPAVGLCLVPESLPAGWDLSSLAVIADAVTTPWEAIRRSGLDSEDAAVFVGAGGIGSFGVQIASAKGAAVIAVDVDDDRLALAKAHGAALTLNPKVLGEKELKAAIRAFVKESGKRRFGLKIFETSGTKEGQLLAYGLLERGAHLAVVGFTPAKIEVRLSNLMALDATAAGNWGCPPDQYPAALDLVLSGKIAMAPFIETHALDSAPEVFEAVAQHTIRRRVVFTPTNGS
jgi:6-hydroxycyclohex-1-ene-1-carbonyl-CoA dehydrogenase